MRWFEKLVLWFGIALAIFLLALSIRAKNPVLGGIGVLLGALCAGTMRELNRGAGGRGQSS